jgi:serine/threonine protein phosphatase PrpC
MESIPDPQLSDTGASVAFEELVARFYEDEPSAVVQVEFGALSHPGLVRDKNEDHYAVVRRRRVRDMLLSNLPVEGLKSAEQEAYALVVADGLGGHPCGELASLLALWAAWDLGSNEIKWTLKMNRRESDELTQKAAVIFGLLDRTLRTAAQVQPRLFGMGTTLTACYTTGPELFVLHAGDSRAYLYRGGALCRLTRDHARAGDDRRWHGRAGLPRGDVRSPHADQLRGQGECAGGRRAPPARPRRPAAALHRRPD